MTHTIRTIKNNRGFTLIEIMIALVIFGLISTAIYATYNSQQNTYLTQEKIVEMQQNIRAAVYFMERDIRMMGYDPTENASAPKNSNGIGRAAELRFAFDDNGDGTIQSTEYIRYALTSDGSNGINDSSRDGTANSFPCSLGRETGISPNNSGLQPVAENVQALEFFYHFEDGSTDTVCSTQTDRENVRSIDVSILVRTKNPIMNYKDTKTYYPASNVNRVSTGKVWGPFNDNYRRKIMISNIKCRNMGLGG